MTYVSSAQKASFMKITIAALALVMIAGCTTNDSEASSLATRLAGMGGSNLSKEERTVYIDCGKEALAALPKYRLRDALKATDAPAIWKILGSNALDQYVQACRKVDLNRTSGGTAD